MNYQNDFQTNLNKLVEQLNLFQNAANIFQKFTNLDFQLDFKRCTKILKALSIDGAIRLLKNQNLQEIACRIFTSIRLLKRSHMQISMKQESNTNNNTKESIRLFLQRKKSYSNRRIMLDGS